VTAALAGLRVVELAGDIAGPYCTKLLVDLGAEVTKIEPPSGDPMRGWGPFPGGVPDPNRSGLFEYLNARATTWRFRGNRCDRDGFG
jgi:crotonobetainyl-CoA:carnitine CoA-transferase CaiB-like acyl-CoA transferase